MSGTDPSRRVVVGISGASGVVYAVRLLEVLKSLEFETHLVVSRSAEITVAHELDMKLAAIRALASVNYKNDNVAAAISSGSFRTRGMVVVPCSIRTLSAVASGVTPDLISRAADVVLKERRRLVMVVRETPLHAGHLRSMASVAELGAVIFPPVPAFYVRPRSLSDLVDHTVGRILDQLDIESGLVHRWPDGG